MLWLIVRIAYGTIVRCVGVSDGWIKDSEIGRVSQSVFPYP